MLKSGRNDDAAIVRPAGAPGQRDRDARRSGGDGGRRAGTNGVFGVTGGARDLLIGWVVTVVVVAAAIVVNALTVSDDVPGLAWWEPWSWELTSAAVVLLIVWIPWLAVSTAPPEGRWLRFAAVHAIGLLSYSALHVAGFVALRTWVYARMGGDYDFGPPLENFVYELRKDLLSYAAMASIFWIVRRLREHRAGQGRSTPAAFDIRDGSRIIRAPASDIIAVCSAGNYAEFHLSDGRRPLMRTTLAKLEGELAPLGFVRTHRSWLVNPARVTGLEPDGSGDWTVELGKLEAPLSRRYRDALERLRGD